MQVQDIMTKDPACCTPNTKLREVAQLMVEHDCGAIPVVEGGDRARLVGVVTDRDITCRVVAEGKNPLELTADNCMTTPAVTATPETGVEDCYKLMEEKRIRRVVVVDANGDCCGILTQADIALRASDQEAAEVVKEISEPTEAASALVRN